MVLAEINKIPSISLLLDEKFCISITDRSGVITYVNNNFCKLSQYSENELMGNNYSIVNPDYMADATLQKVELEVKNNNIWQHNIKCFAKDGSPYWVHATIVPIIDSEGVITEFLSIDTDITYKELTTVKYKEAVEDLRNIENALDQSSVVAITDRAGVITYANDKFLKLSQFTSEELIGKTHRLINSGYHPKSFFKEMWDTISEGNIWRGDVKNKAKDGSEYWVNSTIVPFLDKDGKPYQYVSIRSNITARKKAEEALEIALKNDFRQTVKNIQNAIFKYTTDANGKIFFTMLEGKIAENLGFTTEKVNKNSAGMSFTQTEFREIIAYLNKGLEGQATDFEFNHMQYTFLFHLSPIFENDEVIEVVGTAIDITERKNAETTIEHMAFYDYLTGLPNRRLLQKTVTEAIDEAIEKEDTLAVMFIDLDRFKNVNDSMGHLVGDELLKSVSERLKLCVRKKDFVARLNGDEFIILFPSTRPSEVQSVAERILREIAEPFLFNDIEVYVTASVGISMYPRDGEDCGTLISNADSAMYLAKEKGKSNFQFFTQELRDEKLEKALLEMNLRQAIKKDELLLHYQPQFVSETGQLKGLEALARWEHPSLGSISPGRFIPIAEETGLILPIGHWVLKTACMQAKKWQSQGFPPIRISVNVSIRQFKQPSFVADVKQTLAETQLDPTYLNLEITESMTSDVELCRAILNQLKDAGISVSIDDFGTGYSSLSYLSTFPISHLKIDQSFVRELSQSNKVIIKTIIDLAKNLNMTVIAEGVETEEQALFLKNLQCDEMQGFLYSKPLPIKEVEKLLNGK